MLLKCYIPTSSQAGSITGGHSCFQSLSLIKNLFYSKKLKLLKKEEQKISQTLAYKLLETQTDTSVPQSNSYTDFILHHLHRIDKHCSLSVIAKNAVEVCIS